MKNIILLAILAFTMNAFAQNHPITASPKNFAAYSNHSMIPNAGVIKETSGLLPESKLGKGIYYPSRELFNLLQQYDSIYTWQWDTMIQGWQIETKFVDLLYNADYYPTSLTGKVWNGNAWQNYVQYQYGYDAYNNQTALAYKEWSGSNWQNSFQTLYTYDADNNRTSELSQFWTGASWMNVTLYNYTYDIHHNQTSVIEQNWNGTAWVNMARWSYQYNASNKPTTHLYESWDDVNAKWVNVNQDLYAYNANNNLISSTHQTWNLTAWYNVSLATYTYNGDNDQVEEIDQNWNGTGWINAKKYTHTYDAYHDKTNTIIQSWNGASWDNTGRITYNYNVNHGLLKSLTEEWNGLLWKPNSVSFYSYGENDFLSGESNRNYNAGGNYIAYGDSTAYYFHTVSGIMDIATDESILTVAPNPSNGRFTLSSTSNIGVIEIYNYLGEQIFSAKADYGKTSTEINLSGYAKGIYVIVVKDGSKMTQKKVLIQ